MLRRTAKRERSRCWRTPGATRWPGPFSCGRITRYEKVGREREKRKRKEKEKMREISKPKNTRITIKKSLLLNYFPSTLSNSLSLSLSLSLSPTHTGPGLDREARRSQRQHSGTHPRRGQDPASPAVGRNQGHGRARGGRGLFGRELRSQGPASSLVQDVAWGVRDAASGREQGVGQAAAEEEEEKGERK